MAEDAWTAWARQTYGDDCARVDEAVSAAKEALARGANSDQAVAAGRQAADAVTTRATAAQRLPVASPAAGPAPAQERPGTVRAGGARAPQRQEVHGRSSFYVWGLDRPPQSGTDLPNPRAQLPREDPPEERARRGWAWRRPARRRVILASGVLIVALAVGLVLVTLISSHSGTRGGPVRGVTHPPQRAVGGGVTSPASPRTAIPGSSWPYAKLVANLSGRTVSLAHAQIRLDSALLECNGVGPRLGVGPGSRWGRFTCTQTLFGGGADRDVTFDVVVVSTTQVQIVDPRYGSQ